MRLPLATILSVAILAVGTGSALGRYALKGDPEIAAWFRGLKNPSSGFSCCDESDGHILASSDWRIVGDRYEVRIEDFWVPVPPHTVLSRTRNPTGSAVVFYMPGSTRIYCFVRPPEV